MKERSFWKNSFGFIFGIVFMLIIRCNVFAGTGWDSGYICLLPERATSDSVTLKWREPDGDDYCHEAFMSGFRSNYGADGYTDVSYSLKYDEYRGSFDGPDNSYREISLSYPGSVTIHNLGHRLYVAYLVGRFHLDNGRYVERTTGMCVFQPYDGSKQSYEINKNISDISFATNRLTSEYESSWEYGVQYTRNSSFCTIDILSGSVDLCVNYHNEGGYFFEDNMKRHGLYAGKGRVVQDLTPSTRYNVRILPIIGVGDSWYDMAGELAFDYENAQTFTVTTKGIPKYISTVKNLKVVSCDGDSRHSRITWKVVKHLNNGPEFDRYQLECTNLSTGKKDIIEWSNAKYWKQGAGWLANYKNNTFYKIRLRGVLVGEGGDEYSKWSNYTYFNPQQTSKKDVKLKPTKRTIKATWKKVAGASNYTIYISDTPRGTYRKVATTSKTSYTIKKFRGRKLQSKKRYYLKIVANKKVGSKVYRSNSNYYIKTKTK